MKQSHALHVVPQQKVGWDKGEVLLTDGKCVMATSDNPLVRTIKKLYEMKKNNEMPNPELCLDQSSQPMSAEEWKDAYINQIKLPKQ